MTEHELVEWASNLDDYTWQVYATQVMWFHRKGGTNLSALPDKLVLVGGLVTDKGEWARVRKTIAAKRRARRREAEAAWRRSNAERRREYMREYMREYRKE